MKTTIDIADPVLNQAKKLAAREGTTLRALVEQGLQQVIADRRTHKKQARAFRPVVFHGDGLTPEFENASWSEILAASYEGRGG